MHERLQAGGLHGKARFQRLKQLPHAGSGRFLQLDAVPQAMDLVLGSAERLLQFRAVAEQMQHAAVLRLLRGSQHERMAEDSELGKA